MPLKPLDHTPLNPAPHDPRLPVQCGWGDDDNNDPDAVSPNGRRIKGWDDDCNDPDAVTPGGRRLVLVSGAKSCL